MEVKESKVITVKFEAHEFAMFVDLLEMARQVRSKKHPTMNVLAQDLLDHLGGDSAKS